MKTSGACDFASTIRSRHVAWTAKALPTVVFIGQAPPAITALGLQSPAPQQALLKASASTGSDWVGTLRESPFELSGEVDRPAAILPMDQLFEVRIAAALRLWRAMTGRTPGPNVGALGHDRRNRLILALRAVDGRLAGATHRQIADGLFDTSTISDRDWLTHDLRDRTGRLVRLGQDLMSEGYRRLLLHPYRGRI